MVAPGGAPCQDALARRDRPAMMARFSLSTLGSSRHANSFSERSRSSLATHGEDGARQLHANSFSERSRSSLATHEEDGARQLHRSWSEPIADAEAGPGSRPGFVSPCGLVSPSSLRATSGLHKRHQADMRKYGVRMMEANKGQQQCPGPPPLEPGDLRRGHAPPARAREAAVSWASAQGTQGMLVHVRDEGNPSVPPEQTFVMPHPFRGQALREGSSCCADAPRAQGTLLLQPRAAAQGSWECPASSLFTGGQAEGELETVSMMELYNAVVDGLAGRLVVDTRGAEEYDDCHVFGAVDLEEALTYNGKHVYLVSSAGEIGPGERKILGTLQCAPGILSIKVVRGGMEEWRRKYPFLCERTAASHEEEMQQRRTRMRHTYPSQVLDWLFISGTDAAQDQKVMADLEITHVLSVLADPDKVRVPRRCKRLMIPLRDEVSSDLAASFEEAWEFISAGRQSAGKILVHCKMGRSRSAGLVLMALCRSGQFSLRSAWQHLRACRRQTAVNAGFVKQLIAFEQRLTGGKASVSWNESSQRLVLD